MLYNRWSLKSFLITSFFFFSQEKPRYQNAFQLVKATKVKKHPQMVRGCSTHFSSFQRVAPKIESFYYDRDILACGVANR